MFSGDEVDLLEIRLNTLDSIINKFVIGECSHSHSGIYKGLKWNDIKQRFDNFKDKIEYVEIPYIPSNNPFVNEHHGRDYIYNAIENKLKANDTLVICDLDEIPHPEVLKEQIKDENLNQPTTLLGDYFLFCLNLWARTSIDGFIIKNYWKRGTLNEYRSHRTNWAFKDGFKHIPDASWHFSSVNTPENSAKKMSYFCHAPEFTGDVRNPEYIKKLIQAKCGNFRLDEPNVLQEYPIEKLPIFIQRNKEKFKHLFYENYLA